MDEKKFSPEFVKANKERRFGAPKGNKPVELDHKLGGQMRQFYRWVQTATKKDVEAFMADETKPAIQRRFLSRFLNGAKPRDYFDFTNQIEGMPVQPISTEEMPDIIIDLSGNGENKG